ncbi:MAG: hypothetical protein ABEJ40_02715 [Haloarculaceae archaeon]
MPADAGLLAVEMLLAAFAGGALGGALGPLPSLSLAGVVVALGELSSPGPGSGAGTGAGGAANGGIGRLADAGSGAGIDVGLVSQRLTALVGLGPALGPHVAFAGGVAAAAYAGRKGYLDDGSEYHRAKQVATGLGSRPDVLVVGGAFGVVGYWLAQLSIRLNLPWEPVAASVVLSGFLHRIVFGYPLVGSPAGGLLDMTPYEEGERRMRTDGSDADGSLAGRYLVEPWLPAHYGWANVTLLGLVVGVFGGFLALATGSYYFAFGLAAATLAFACAGVDRFPVTHHMALPASIAALALPEVGVAVAILAAGAFGVVAGLVGEVSQRVLYAHADTHLDPSFVSILVTSLLIAALDVAGVLSQSAIPTAGLV